MKRKFTSDEVVRRNRLRFYSDMYHVDEPSSAAEGWILFSTIVLVCLILAGLVTLVYLDGKDRQCSANTQDVNIYQDDRVIEQDADELSSGDPAYVMGGYKMRSAMGNPTPSPLP